MNPMEILTGKVYNDDNLHRIAISNLKTVDGKLRRWWEKKYQTPEKSFDEHIFEELIVKILEDFYEANPQEIERFEYKEEESGWEGNMGFLYEKNIKETHKKFFEKNKVSLSKYQSDKELSEEEEKKILENLGLKLRNSKKEMNFEDNFEVLGG